MPDSKWWLVELARLSLSVSNGSSLQLLGMLLGWGLKAGLGKKKAMFHAHTGRFLSLLKCGLNYSLT